MKKFLHLPLKVQAAVIGALVFFLFIGAFYLQAANISKARSSIQSLTSQNTALQKQAEDAKTSFEKLKGVDQFKRNEALQKEISDLESTYQQAGTTLDQIIDLRDQKEDTTDLEKQYAEVVNELGHRQYATASGSLTKLKKDIASESQKVAVADVTQAVKTAPASVQSAGLPTSNSLSSGYNVQKVHSDVGDFTVQIISADLNSTRVIVDTASDSDCSNNCLVLPLDAYVSRTGAFAGINGTYFCPASYPSCAGKTNSFDLLVMNNKKHYFNSDNNVYSTNPAVIFSGNSARFVGRVQEWGRDTGVDSVISNYPLLVSGGAVAFSGDGDPKHGSAGPRCFIGTTGSTVYIGIVQNATEVQAAHVIQTLGIQNALNLDEGGSTALWYGGYKAGPGRSLPNAVLFVHK